MSSRSLLIVAADPSAARELESTLTELGYDVSTAPSARDAVARPSSTTLDMVLLDLELARTMEARYFSVSIDMLCVAGFDGYFKRLNRAWEQTLGFTCEELMAQPSIEFVHPDDRQRTIDQNRQVKVGGHARGFENRYRCRDGGYRWLLWNAAPDADGQVIYSAARDITDRRRADAEREALLRDLQAALAEVQSLQQILPICSYCRKVRTDENYWQNVETYFAQRTQARFSHGVCPSCYATASDRLLGDPSQE